MVNLSSLNLFCFVLICLKQKMLRTAWIDKIWVCWVYWWLVEMFMVTLVQKSVKSAHFSLFYDFKKE